MSDLDLFQSQDFSADYRLRALFSMIPAGGVLLDIGSGNGAIANMRRNDYSKFVLADSSPALVERLSGKFRSREDVEVSLQDARNLSWKEEFDCISACDILEHIPEDDICVRAFAQALKPKGALFISVPAHPWLYGARDKKYGHLRRYTKSRLETLLKKEGFEVEHSRYWNAVGVLPYIVSEKIFKKPLVAPARTEKRGFLGRMVNTALYAILKLETYLPLPFGLSLIVICKKKA